MSIDVKVLDSIVYKLFWETEFYNYKVIALTGL